MPQKKVSVLQRNKAALLGIVSLLPFLLLNGIIVNRVEPFFSLIRPTERISILEYSLFITMLFCMPVGAYLSLKPVIHDKKLYPLNILIATLGISIFLLLFYVIGAEVYRCEVLHIPNCD